jgi:hypothetical protein
MAVDQTPPAMIFNRENNFPNYLADSSTKCDFRFFEGIAAADNKFQKKYPVFDT